MAFEPYHRDSPVVSRKSGVKSPSRVSREVFRGSQATRPARHDFSRARARAIEASLDPDEPWVPASEPNNKTPEEEVSSANIFGF